MKLWNIGPGDWGYRPGAGAIEYGQRERNKKTHKEMSKHLRKHTISFFGDVLVLSLVGYFFYWMFFT